MILIIYLIISVLLFFVDFIICQLYEIKFKFLRRLWQCAFWVWYIPKEIFQALNANNKEK